VSTLRLDEARPRVSLSRFAVFGLAVVLVVTTLGLRLSYLQLTEGSYYSGRAAANRIVLEPVPSSRGLIFDRNGDPLVQNVPSFAVKVRPGDMPSDRRDEVVGRLAHYLGMEAGDVNVLIDRNPGSRFDLVRIASDVPVDLARLISEDRLLLPGVEVVAEARRDYIYGPLTAQLLGYTGAVDEDELKRLRDQGYLADDVLGKAGVETTYESFLRGRYGVQQVERDATGRQLDVLATLEDPQSGDSLQLTVDLRTQRLAEKALAYAMNRSGLQRGVIAVMNPQTGEILALVSLPTYDDNLFAKGISNADFQALVNDPGKPLTDHAMANHFSPGSSYKLVTATGALADGKITTRTILQTAPYLTIGQARYVEHGGHGFGPLDIYGGFAWSSDTFFYQLSGMLGIDRLAYWAQQYGFGQPTGVDLPGEVAGIVPSNQWKYDTLGEPIYPGETYHAGIGQGFDEVTPLQVLNAYAALANGGTLYKPQVVRKVVASDGTVLRDFQPEVNHELDVDPDVLTTMRIASRRVVSAGYTVVGANRMQLNGRPFILAGKSGTAEFGVRDAQGRLPYHTWFVGFVPKALTVAPGTPTEVEARANTLLRKADSQLAVVGFAYSSNSFGNIGTEIVKYFLQLYYGLDNDYRWADAYQKTNFYETP
jgi:penicillin-binding protein 2